MAPLFPGWGVGKARWACLLVSAWNYAVVRLQGGERDQVQAPAETQIS